MQINWSNCQKTQTIYTPHFMAVKLNQLNEHMSRLTFSQVPASCYVHNFFITFFNNCKQQKQKHFIKQQGPIIILKLSCATPWFGCSCLTQGSRLLRQVISLLYGGYAAKLSRLLPGSSRDWLWSNDSRRTVWPIFQYSLANAAIYRSANRSPAREGSAKLVVKHLGGLLNNEQRV